MNIFDVQDALTEAERVLDAARRQVDGLVSVLGGRLRFSSNTWRSTQNLAKLKRELRDFNITTGKWRS